MKQLSQEEILVLREADEFLSAQGTPFWKKIRARMVNHVDEAASLLEGCQSSDDRVRLGLLSAWQQRKKMLDAVDGYIASVIEARKALLEDLAKEHGIESPEAVDLLSEPYITQ